MWTKPVGVGGALRLPITELLRHPYPRRCACVCVCEQPFFSPSDIHPHASQTIVHNPSLVEATPPAAVPVFEPKGSSNTGGIVVGVLLGLLLLAAVGAGVWVIQKRRKVRRNRESAGPMPAECVAMAAQPSSHE